MTQIELRYMEVVVHQLPLITKALQEIATTLQQLSKQEDNDISKRH